MENEIKNTAPAVMTDTGPRGTTRKKSKDGRYTADVEVEEEYQDPEHQLSASAKSATAFSQKKGEKLIEDAVSFPLFVNNFYQKFILPSLNGKLKPNQEPYIIQSNSYNDIRLGIDLQLGIRQKNEDGTVTFDNSQLREIDIKTLDTYGSDENYDNPRIPFNLYKYTNNKWSDGAYLNKNHINNVYCFIAPKSDLRRNDIIANLQKDPNYVPPISEVRFFWTSRSQLRRYVHDRILNNEHVQNLMQAFKDNDIQQVIKNPKRNPYFNDTREEYKTNSFHILIPIPGETFKAELQFQTSAETGNKQIRLHIPSQMFNTSVKSIHKRFKLS